MKSIAKPLRTSTITKAEAAYAFVTGPRPSAAALLGRPGIGKTTAAEWLSKNYHHCRLVTATKGHSTYRRALAAIGHALDIGGCYGPAANVREVLEWSLPEKAYCGYCLIIDEAQRLDLDVLVEIVDFPERFGLPVILFGNPDLLKRTNATQSAFAQIDSRIAMKVLLTNPLRDDYRLLLADYDVMDPDAREAGERYGDKTSIRELVALLGAAKQHAGKGPVQLDHMRLAARQLRGGQQALGLLAP